MKPNLPFPEVWVISLPESAERRERVTQALGAIPFEIFPAVDGRRLEPEAAVAETAIGRRLAPREAGCAESHLRLYEEIVKRRVARTVVLEDDAAPLEPFRAVVEAICRGADPWDLVLLGHWSLQRDRSALGAETAWFGRRELTDRHSLCRLAEFPLGTHGYLISLHGARKLLRGGRPLRMPADFLTGTSERWGANLWAVSPPVVVPSGAASTIGVRAHQASEIRAGPAALRERFLAGMKRGLKTVWGIMRKAGICRSSYVLCFSRMLQRDCRRPMPRPDPRSPR